MSAASSEGGVEAESGSLLTRLAHHLHEICQPLTALQCRIEIEQMEREGGEADRVDTTLAECLRECGRLNERVNTMRTLVRSALQSERTNEREGHQ